MAEKVLIKNGIFEIDPARMQEYVKQQVMNDEERKLIIKNRHAYLEWMHKHFAGCVVKPPVTEE